MCPTFILLRSAAPSASPPPLDASPAGGPTRDEGGPLPDATRQPSEPARQRGRNKGNTNILLPQQQHPQGSPLLGAVETQEEIKTLDSTVTERNKDKDIPLFGAPEFSLQYIPISPHAVGTSFLSSVDVKRVKHVSEMLNIENEE
jgi:hypothetical protein